MVEEMLKRDQSYFRPNREKIRSIEDEENDEEVVQQIEQEMDYSYLEIHPTNRDFVNEEIFDQVTKDFLNKLKRFFLLQQLNHCTMSIRDIEIISFLNLIH